VVDGVFAAYVGSGGFAAMGAFNRLFSGNGETDLIFDKGVNVSRGYRFGLAEWVGVGFHFGFGVEVMNLVPG
jgi:hypothetical protein